MPDGPLLLGAIHQLGRAMADEIPVGRRVRARGHQVDDGASEKEVAESIRAAVLVLQRQIDMAAARGLSVGIDVQTIADLSREVERPVLTARIHKAL